MTLGYGTYTPIQLELSWYVKKFGSKEIGVGAKWLQCFKMIISN